MTHPTLPPESPREKIANAVLILTANTRVTLDNAFQPADHYHRAMDLLHSAIAQIDRTPEHRCGLPASIVEALNAGDGTYRP